MTGPSAASSRPVTLKVTLECDLGEVRAAVQSIHDFLNHQGWSKDDLMSFDLVLVEACNNAIRYATDGGQEKPLLLEVICEADHVEFRVHDHTPGFKWPDRIELPDPESESGRGLYLISKLMDSSGYFRGQGENILIMRKRRPAGAAALTVENESHSANKSAEDARLIDAMVEELSSCYESLSAIFRYSSEGHKTGNLKAFVHKLARDLAQIISAEWFVVRLAPPGESRLVVYAASESALDLAPLPFPAHDVPVPSVELEAALSRRSVWFDFEKPLPPFGPLTKVKPGSSGLAQPIMLGNDLIGTLTLGKIFPKNAPPMPARSVFTAGQTNVINTFADFLAIQIANARFQEEHVAQRLVRHELEIATTIQRSLLLTSLPQLQGFSLAAFCRSAHEVGGDFYDVLKINEHSMLLVIADVMGKGIPAAMFAAMLRTLIRAAPELTHQPAALLGRVNRLLFPELSGVDMFITAQLAFIDAKNRKLTVAGAGHCPLAVATAGGVKTFSPEGMPLGIQPETSFQESTVDLPEKCRVLIYTDGLTDVINAGKEHFGQERLMAWLAKSPAKAGTAEQLKQELAEELQKHQSDAALSDDQTFLILAG